MRFSLIMATVGRSETIPRLFDSLLEQASADVQLIVVDQNEDDRLVPLVQQYGDRLDITHLRAPRGLSRARNVGLSHVDGDVIGFPDDDCWYPANVLTQIATQFEDNEVDGLSFRVTNEIGKNVHCWWDTSAGAVDRYNIWFRCNSNSVFFRRATVEAIGDFDESLGVGAGTAWEAAEDLDYLLRAVLSGRRVHYTPEIHVLHPDPLPDDGPTGREKAYRYGRAAGYILGKYRYPLHFVMLGMLHPLVMLLADLRFFSMDRLRCRTAAVRGRFVGWREGCRMRD